MSSREGLNKRTSAILFSLWRSFVCKGKTEYIKCEILGQIFQRRYFFQWQQLLCAVQHKYVYVSHFRNILFSWYTLCVGLPRRGFLLKELIVHKTRKRFMHAWRSQQRIRKTLFKRFQGVYIVRVSRNVTNHWSQWKKVTKHPRQLEAQTCQPIYTRYLSHTRLLAGLERKAYIQPPHLYCIRHSIYANQHTFKESIQIHIKSDIALTSTHDNTISIPHSMTKERHQMQRGARIHYKKLM